MHNKKRESEIYKNLGVDGFGRLIGRIRGRQDLVEACHVEIEIFRRSKLSCAAAFKDDS